MSVLPNEGSNRQLNTDIKTDKETDMTDGKKNSRGKEIEEDNRQYGSIDQESLQSKEKGVVERNCLHSFIGNRLTYIGPFVPSGAQSNRKEREIERERKNKAGYTAIQSRTVGQEQ